MLLGRVLQRSQRELWTMTALLIPLSLVCIHLGIMVWIISNPSTWYLSSNKMSWMSSSLYFSSSLIQWRVSRHSIKPASLWSLYCGVTPLYKTYVGCTQFSALCWDDYWCLEVFGSWLNSLEPFSSVPIGTQHIVYITRTKKEWMINPKNEMVRVGSKLTC